MARHDYSEDGDFYTQDFQREGLVSVWLGFSDGSSEMDADVLQDLCGVGYYSLDDQEANNHDFKLVPVEELLGPLSYSPSFVDAVVAKASSMGLAHARWIIVQYDFAYSPEKVLRAIASDPKFLGVFEYSTEEQDA
jgi:hypothetical protein